jgi:hypothetical protein
VKYGTIGKVVFKTTFEVNEKPRIKSGKTENEVAKT